MQLKIIFVILILSGCSWSKADKALLAASSLAAAADAYTIMRAQDNPDNWEINPAMGKHPSDSRVIIYKFTVQVAALILAHYSPKWRSWILGGKTAFNTGSALYNNRLD